jgi:2-polyprenyl-3-methyl-5-hydroxy-6-metoxy-1,4-benzoquinol methylase
VLDDGCGVAAAVIEIARFGAQVTAVGIERLLMERAEDNPER